MSDHNFYTCKLTCTCTGQFLICKSSSHYVRGAVLLPLDAQQVSICWDVQAVLPTSAYRLGQGGLRLKLRANSLSEDLRQNLQPRALLCHALPSRWKSPVT